MVRTQDNNHIAYLLSSLRRQHHYSTSFTTTDPSLHDGLGSSKLLALVNYVDIVKTAGASGRPAQKPLRRSFGSALEAARPACGRGRRSLRGRAACRYAGRSRKPLPHWQGEGVQKRERDHLNDCLD
jgi:hypothetical protein